MAGEPAVGVIRATEKVNMGAPGEHRRAPLTTVPRHVKHEERRRIDRQDAIPVHPQELSPFEPPVFHLGDSWEPWSAGTVRRAQARRRDHARPPMAAAAARPVPTITDAPK